jgi:hypothetical protein
MRLPLTIDSIKNYLQQNYPQFAEATAYFFPVTRRIPPPMMATTPRIGGNGTVLVSFLEAWIGPRSTTFFWCV